MKFTVVIPAYRPTTLDTAIESIRRQSYTDWDLVVVGQGREAGVREAVERHSAIEARVRYAHIPRNGTCRARNAGAQSSTSEYLAFIDDDCEAREDWLSTLANYLDSKPEIGLVGGAVIRPPKPRPGIAVCPQVIPSESVYDPSATPGRPPAGWDWIGCNLGIRRTVYERIGPFDEYLGPGTDFPAGEDTDYKLRLEAAGVKMAATPTAVVWHTHGYRYGVKVVIRNARNYAYGNNGLAGKLTLLGDARGADWQRITRRQCLTDWLKLKPWRLPIDLFRLKNAVDAYQLCLSRYRVDNGLLCPREG